MGEVSSTAVRGAGSSRAAREKANPRSRVRGGESRAADARASSSPFALGEASRTRSATRESAPRRGKRLDPKRGSGPTAYLKSTVRRPALLDGTPPIFSRQRSRSRSRAATALARRARSVDARQRPTERIYRRTRAQPSPETEVRGSAWAKWRPADSRFHTSVRGLSPNSRIDRGFGSCTRVCKKGFDDRASRFANREFSFDDDDEGSQTLVQNTSARDPRVLFGMLTSRRAGRATRTTLHPRGSSCSRRPALRRALSAFTPPVSPSRARCRVGG